MGCNIFPKQISNNTYLKCSRCGTLAPNSLCITQRANATNYFPLGLFVSYIFDYKEIRFAGTVSPIYPRLGTDCTKISPVKCWESGVPYICRKLLFYSHFFYLITPASQKYKCEAIDSVLEWKITYRSIKQSKTSMCNLILSFDPKCGLVFCTEHSNSSKQTFIT